MPVAPPQNNGQPDLDPDAGDDSSTGLLPFASSAPPAPTVLETATQSALNRTGVLLDAHNPASIASAREGAQNALRTLSAAIGVPALSARALPGDTLSVRLSVGAIESLALWGRAADGFGRRDEAITAFVRAKSLLSALPTAPGGTLARDVNLELNALLRGGLPLVAPDDVLTNIAARAHENLWHPRRFDFALAPGSGSATAAKSALLVTEGQLFPPAQRNQNLVRIPPMYQGISLDRLPSSLQLNRMIAGYTRIARGAGAGQWRQTVRVFYASPFLTRQKRDDSPRAEGLAAQFLRVHMLFESKLGATNRYASDPSDEGVTTLYLLEVSALWPQDDDDPVVLSNMGPKMPPINTGPRPSAFQVQSTPLVRPWIPVAGQNEGSPGEILFWKAGAPRSEGEWVRELFHEYGHVSLPPFGGFRAPLEPYGNGLIGETLGMMWAAQNPDFASLNGAVGPKSTSGAGIPRSDFLLHVRAQALPARVAFLTANPLVPHTGGTLADLRFLQGLAVVCERTYGSQVLGRAFTPLTQRGVNATSVAARRSLLNATDLLQALEPAMRASFAARRVLPIYLPAALNLNLDAPTLVARTPVTVRGGARMEGWLFVPAGASSLRIESPALCAVGLPWKLESGATKIYFGGKSGWQHLALVARANATIGAARFE